MNSYIQFTDKSSSSPNIFCRNKFPKHSGGSLKSAKGEDSKSMPKTTKRYLIMMRKVFTWDKNKDDTTASMSMEESGVPLLDYTEMTRNWQAPESDDDLGAIKPDHLPAVRLLIIY